MGIDCRDLSSTDWHVRVDVSLSQGQIPRLHHSPKRPRRSVRAKSCFSEKDRGETACGCHPQPASEAGAPHRPQKGARWNRRGETGRCEAARPGIAEGTDPQKCSSSPQKQNGESRKVKLTRNRKGASRRPFLLHRGQLAAASLAIPLGRIVRRPALWTLERFVLFRSGVLCAACFRNRRRSCDRCRRRRAGSAPRSKNRKIIEWRTAIRRVLRRLLRARRRRLLDASGRIERWWLGDRRTRHHRRDRRPRAISQYRSAGRDRFGLPFLHAQGEYPTQLVQLGVDCAFILHKARELLVPGPTDLLPLLVGVLSDRGA